MISLEEADLPLFDNFSFSYVENFEFKNLDDLLNESKEIEEEKKQIPSMYFLRPKIIKKEKTRENISDEKTLLDKYKTLPLDHKPARGRARMYQKTSMSKKQLKEESEIRLEKNRLAAKECRKRKKEYIDDLETRIENYKFLLKDQEKEIIFLKNKIKILCN